jgi:hypothetical protein
LFRAGSTPGKSPSELSPLRRCPDVSARADSPTVSPSGFSAAEAPDRPDGLRFLSFDPPKSPLTPGMCLAHQALEAPLGFVPFRVRSQQPCSGFRQNSSHALCGREPEDPLPPAPQSLDRLPPGPPADITKTPAADETTLLGFLRRQYSRAFDRSALRAMDSPHAAQDIAALDQRSLEVRPICRSCPGLA